MVPTSIRFADTPPCVTSGAPLANCTTLRLGGVAQYAAEAYSEHEVFAVLDWASRVGVPVTVLGAGSNMVVSDKGVQGLVLLLKTQRVEYVGATGVVADAGANWDQLVRQCCERRLWGVELLAGIPGTVGAAPVQNISAYGQRISDALVSVRAFDLVNKAIVVLDRSACGFGHRTSVFKRLPGRWLILNVTLNLRRTSPREGRLQHEVRRELAGLPRTPAEVRLAVLAVRQRKSMLADPTDQNARSVGSFFVSPHMTLANARATVAHGVRTGVITSGVDIPIANVGSGMYCVPGGWMIERVGYRRGYQHGAVGLSARHALALVNCGNGSTQELLELAIAIQTKVMAGFGIRLVPEAVFAGEGCELSRALWGH